MNRNEDSISNRIKETFSGLASKSFLIYALFSLLNIVLFGLCSHLSMRNDYCYDHTNVVFTAFLAVFAFLSILQFRVIMRSSFVAHFIFAILNIIISTIALFIAIPLVNLMAPTINEIFPISSRLSGNGGAALILIYMTIWSYACGIALLIPMIYNLWYIIKNR